MLQIFWCLTCTFKLQNFQGSNYRISFYFSYEDGTKTSIIISTIQVTFWRCSSLDLLQNRLPMEAASMRIQCSPMREKHQQVTYLGIFWFPLLTNPDFEHLKTPSNASISGHSARQPSISRVPVGSKDRSSTYAQDAPKNPSVTNTPAPVFEVSKTTKKKSGFGGKLLNKLKW